MKITVARAIHLLVVIGLLSFAANVTAQSSKPGPSFKPNPNLNDQEKRGQYVFLQRCALCHVTKYGKDVAAPRLPPIWVNLEGLFKNTDSDKETEVRGFILEGTSRMPGWQYTLETKQIDDVIAYLKTL